MKEHEGGKKNERKQMIENLEYSDSGAWWINEKQGGRGGERE